MSNSYQRRKREIKCLKERVKDLTQIAKGLAEQLERQRTYRPINDLSGFSGMLSFRADVADYNNCVDISSEASISVTTLPADGDDSGLVRHFIVRMSKRDLPGLIEVLTEFNGANGEKP